MLEKIKRIFSSNKYLRYHKKVAILFVIFLFLENCVLVYDNIQNKAPILGIRVEGAWLGLSGRANLSRFVQTRIESNNRPLKFSYGSKISSVTQRELGAKVSVPVVVNQILQRGRTGNALGKLIEQNKALIGLSDVKIQGTLSPALLALKILEIQNEVDQNALPRRPDISHDLKVILPASEGKRVQADKLSMLILKYIFNPPREPISVPTYKVFPNSYSDQDIKKVQSDFSKISLAPISIASGGQILTLTTSDIKNLLTIVERPAPNNSKKSVLSIRLDDVKLRRRLGEFADKVEEATQAEFDHDDAPSAIYSQFYSNIRRLVTLPTGARIVNRKVLGAVISNGPKTVYLTFDDGPNSIYHPLILDILKNYNVKATFFLIGQNVSRNSSVARKTLAEGHVVGNHTLDHLFLPNYSPSTILSEIQSTNTILNPILGANPILFRPPYGGVNAYVTNAVSSLGLKMYLWDVDPKDWSEPSTDDLVNRVVNNVFDGADVLMHSNHLATVKALPIIIQKLQAQGYIFKTLPR